MKTLLLLFLFTLAPAFAGCPNGLTCDADTSCRACHNSYHVCQYTDDCADCGMACAPIEGGLIATHPRRDPLTDMGRAFLAATMPSVFRRPVKTPLPAIHPIITPSEWAKMAPRPKGQCKASVDIQVLAVSMLRGKL